MGRIWAPKATEYDKQVGIDKVMDEYVNRPSLPDIPEFHEKPLHYFLLNFGPQHPAAHGVLRLILELDQEVLFFFYFEIHIL